MGRAELRGGTRPRLPPPAEVATAQQTLKWAGSAGTEITWGRSHKDGSFSCRHKTNSGLVTLFAVYSSGSVWVELRALGEDRWQEVALRYAAIEGVSLDTDRPAQNRAIPLAKLCGDDPFNQFLEVVNWVRSELGAEA